jgi:hypothetical protein
MHGVLDKGPVRKVVPNILIYLIEVYQIFIKKLAILNGALS